LILLAALLVGTHVASPAAAAATYRVVLDAGHGGKDPGAISPLLAPAEKEVTLRLAVLTGAALQRRGVDVVLTRTADRDVGLRERVVLAERMGAHALVSLHLNSAPTSAASGAEAWHGNGAQHAALAEALLNALAPPLRARGMSVRGTRAGPQLAVLQTTIPATLIELGYVTNPADARLLGDDSFLTAAADALAQGIVRFRDQPRSGTATAMRTASLTTNPVTAIPNLYFVQLGDTLASIASRLGMPVAELQRLNPLVAPQQLQVGQPVQVSTPAAARPGAGAATTTLPAGLVTSAARQTLPASHTVRSGETLSEIALRYGLTTADLARWNNLADADSIRAGDQLRLSVSSAAPSAARTGSATAAGSAATRGAPYVVRPGDTLSDIALRHGVTLDALRQANALADPDQILAGTTLRIPSR
jgi:N-acetylmuramoyl-L-alanine amidase/LysM repeat protein